MRYSPYLPMVCSNHDGVMIVKGCGVIAPDYKTWRFRVKCRGADPEHPHMVSKKQPQPVFYIGREHMHRILFDCGRNFLSAAWGTSSCHDFDKFIHSFVDIDGITPRGHLLQVSKIATYMDQHRSEKMHGLANIAFSWILHNMRRYRVGIIHVGDKLMIDPAWTDPMLSKDNELRTIRV